MVARKHRRGPVVASASRNCGSYCPSCKIWQRHRFKGNVAQTVLASSSRVSASAIGTITLIQSVIRWAPSIILEDDMERTYRWIYEAMQRRSRDSAQLRVGAGNG